MQTSKSLSWFFLKLKCLLVSLCVAVASINSTALVAQEIDADIEAPTISHMPKDGGEIGQPQNVIVTVTDDAAVEDVTLFYRFGESGDFFDERMKQTQENQFEAIALPNNKTAKTFYYYIKATDTSGNITFSGYKFSPKSWALTSSSESQAGNELQSNDAVSATLAAEPSTTQTVNPEPVAVAKSGNRTLYTVLGILAAVVVVGAVANSGSDGGGSQECQAVGCAVQFTSTTP